MEGLRVHGERFMRMFALLLPLAAALVGRGAIAGESDSLCIHFAAASPNLHLELRGDYTMSGVLPLTLCDLEYDEVYRVAVDGPGMERRIGTCTIGRSGRPRFGGLRSGAMLRNTLLPGWGSVFVERKWVGFMDGVTLAASLYAAYTAEQEYHHLRNRFDTLSEMLARAETLDEIDRIQEAAHITSREVNIQNHHRTRLFGLCAFLYGHQALEPLFTAAPPRTKTEAGGNVVTVGSGQSLRFKAFLYSLIRPGRGQFYQGKTTRGVFFSTMSTVSALLALDFHNRYDKGTIEYELAVARYDAAATVDEKLHWRDEAAAAWDDLTTDKQRRDAAYIALAGIWGLSLVDALFPGGAATGTERYAFDFGGGGCALVLRF